MRNTSFCLIIFSSWLLVALVYGAPLREEICPDYNQYAHQRHLGNRSLGRHQLPFQRPLPKCRTLYSKEVEEAIERLRPKIADPDLFRLFENSYPNTLDTMVKWKGFAWVNETEGDAAGFTDEDLAFVITGDMYISRHMKETESWRLTVF